MDKTIWIVGDFKGEYDKGHHAWEILGATYTEERAVSFCTKDSHFVAPIEMDKRLPDDTIDWQGCYYPLAKKDNHPIPPTLLAKREKELAGLGEEGGA